MQQLKSCSGLKAVPAARQVPSVRPASARLVAAAAKKGDKGGLDGKGFISSDNSGRGNIFPTASKAFYSSPRSSAVASSGLGGAQGLGVIAAALAIVVVATAGVSLQEGNRETLAQINNSYNGDSLSVVAGRLAKSL